MRQLKSGLQTYAGGNQEFSYFIKYGTQLRLVKTQNISQSDENNWVNTHTTTASNGNLDVFTQIQQTGSNASIVVNNYEVVSPNLLGGGIITTIGSNYVNGAIQLCVAGCKDCSSGTCTECNSGYALVTTSSTCLGCAVNCLTCSSSNINLCYSCAPGYFISGTSCKQCSSICLSCSGSSDSCTVCPPGQYFDASNKTCTSCSRNCLSCNSTNCTSCRGGFVAVGSSCRSCIMSCSTCSPSDITVCTSCYKGLQLVNGACVSCPDKCLECYNGACITCITGYHPSTSNTALCVADCQLPCATCQDGQPSVCLSCFSGSILSNNTCVQNTSCSTTHTCTDCGVGNNYILVGGNCQPCGSIDYCLQCRSTNSDACSICKTGYYVQNDLCSSCPSSCVSCISSSVCTQCVTGYTLPTGFSQGQCLQCTSPCLTCYGSQVYCTSCVSGYTKSGWKCQSNLYVGFTLVLTNTNLTSVLSSVDSIVIALLSKLKVSDTKKVDLITFNSFKAGSVVVSGGATP